MIQQEASVHEKTVQAVARGEFEVPRQHRRSAGRNATPTHNTKVHPKVWKLARQLAHGHMSRVAIINENEVIVLNNRKR